MLLHTATLFAFLKVGFPFKVKKMQIEVGKNNSDNKVKFTLLKIQGELFLRTIHKIYGMSRPKVILLYFQQHSLDKLIVS